MTESFAHRPTHTAINATSPARYSVVIVATLLSLLMLLKTLLIFRININWDEFNFLSHVYEQSRGELTILLQGSYTHLFGWLTIVAGHEVDQILAGRKAMLLMLAVSVLLIWKLASRWLTPASAFAACVCYLAMLPVMKHGGSFRYDSLLTPMLLGSLVALTSSLPLVRRGVIAGILLGASAAISVKTALSIPLVLVIIALWELQQERIGTIRRTMAVATVAAVAAITSAFLVLALHNLSLAEVSQQASQYVATTARKTLLEIPFFPRATAYYETRYEDELAWWLIYGGLFAAIIQRRFRAAAALGLSLTPILFYRNAFPYYYVVMLAPASVLAGVAVETLYRFSAKYARQQLPNLLVSAVAFALCANGAQHAFHMRHDDIQRQRIIVDAVHAVFPEPVEYIDHSGMISSFRKVNFFMSSWGLEDYRRKERTFMDVALQRCTPLLLANRPVLDSTSGVFRRWLLPTDQKLILQSYIPYWGPIKVVGTEFTLGPGETIIATLPCATAYRLETSSPINVNGMELDSGATVDTTNLKLTISAPASLTTDVLGRFVPAATRPAPSNAPPPHAQLYTGL